MLARDFAQVLHFSLTVYLRIDTSGLKDPRSPSAVSLHRCPLFLLHRKLFPEACRPQLTEEMMRQADVEPTLRPTELTIPQFRALADAYACLCAREPGLLNYEFREELRLQHLARMRNTPMDALTDTPGSEKPEKGGK